MQVDPSIGNAYQDIPICLSDVTTRVVMVSRSFADLLGYRSTDLIGRSWQEFLPDDILPEIKKRFESFIVTKQAYVAQITLLKSDRSVVDVEGRSSILFDKDGQSSLVLYEVLPNQTEIDQHFLPDTKLSCAQLVQDMSYELAAYAGHHGLSQLSTALLEISGLADSEIERLGPQPLQRPPSRP